MSPAAAYGTCPNCRGAVYRTASACPYCGFVFRKPEPAFSVGGVGCIVLVLLGGLPIAWCALRSPAPTPASTPTATAVAPVAPPEPPASPGVDLNAFAAWIGAHRDAPQKADIGDPDCEDGRCALYPTGAADGYEVYFFKANPKAFRVSVHAPVQVFCSALGGETVKTWEERAGFMGAGGFSCRFVAGPLKGLAALVENNTSSPGHFNAGVHVYSAEYLRADHSFAEGVADDLSHAR